MQYSIIQIIDQIKRKDIAVDFSNYANVVVIDLNESSSITTPPKRRVLLFSLVCSFSSDCVDYHIIIIQSNDQHSFLAIFSNSLASVINKLRVVHFLLKKECVMHLLR